MQTSNKQELIGESNLETIDIVILKNIRKRIILGLSQEEMAKDIDISIKMVQKYEKIVSKEIRKEFLGD
jgi:DNA-binding XRE family transcriptional regulator